MGKKEKKERKRKKERRKGKRRRKSSFLLVFQRLNNESSTVKKRARLHSKRWGFSPTLGSPYLRAIRWPWGIALTVGLVQE